MLNLQSLLNKKIIFLDGAMGTELIRRGYKATLPLWSAAANARRPDLVYQIHKNYFETGCHIATTNTFRTTPYTYRKANVPEHLAITHTKQAVAIARKAQSDYISSDFFKACKTNQGLVAGSITTLDDCYDPATVPDTAILKCEHYNQVELLVNTAVDLLLIETIHTVREAEILAQAAAKFAANFIISFVVNETGKLLSGENLDAAIKATDFPERQAIMLNCQTIPNIQQALYQLRTKYNGIIGVCPNGPGEPWGECAWNFNESPSAIDSYVNSLIYFQKEFGVKIFGGCCGTTPAYMQAIIQALG